jgi:uncharacterized protein YutE (UPF0331/DUF86 family)
MIAPAELQPALAELRLHLAHLRSLRPRVEDPAALRHDLSLRNNVLRSLQIVCQVVVDVASELSARHRLGFQNYTEAVQNLASALDLQAATAEQLKRLPGLRVLIIHDSRTLDYVRVIEALDGLDTVEELVAAVGRLEGL